MELWLKKSSLRAPLRKGWPAIRSLPRNGGEGWAAIRSSQRNGGEGWPAIRSLPRNGGEGWPAIRSSQRSGERRMVGDEGFEPPTVSV